MFILRSKFETTLWPRIAAPLVAGLLASLAYQNNVQAAQAASYIVSDQDGYGVMECLHQKSECGKIVADAWCESHGHGPARAFGRAEDLTASISNETPRQTAEAGATIISCDD